MPRVTLLVHVISLGVLFIIIVGHVVEGRLTL